MLLKISFFLLILIPFLSKSQLNNSWKLYLNQEEKISSNGDSVQTVEIKKNANTNLKFVFAQKDTAFIKSVIVMDTQDNGIATKTVAAAMREASFNSQELYRQSAGKNISFFIVNIPADPAKAALVRVAPRLFCSLYWIE